MEYVVNTNALTKVYKNHTAVDNVSLHIKRGEIYGFIGKNGAGKTTFMKMLCGLATPTHGDIVLFGKQADKNAKQNRRIGNLIEDPGLYYDMTGFQNLKCKAIAIGVYKKEYIYDVLKQVGLEAAADNKVKSYSLGMKQRLGIAMALVGGPDLLVLDEPINGLDPQGIVEVRETLLKLRDENNMTIMISSHILEELHKIADTFGIINNGKLIQELNKEELESKCQDYLEIRMDDSSKACPIIDKLGVSNYKLVDNNTMYIYEKLDMVGDINTALVKNGVVVRLLNVVTEKLENYFLNLVGGEADV